MEKQAVRWAPLAMVGTLAASGMGCTKPAPGFCCLTFEDCQQFGVDDVRVCEGEQVCAENQCVPTPDAPFADGRPDGPGPDAADACITAGGQILFATDRDGDFELARMWADGTGFVQLTDNTWPDQGAQFSPDGSEIVWLSSSGATELRVMTADGANAHPIATGGSSVAWSPAVPRIAYASGSAIYAVDEDGTDPSTLSQISGSSELGPSWSPSGAKLLFTTTRLISGTTQSRVFIMNPDGSGQMMLYEGPMGSHNPRWSPNGSLIAFTYRAPTYELWRMNTTGGEAMQIHPGAIASSGTAFEWSPDGSRIALESGGSIYTISSTGADLTTIADTGNDHDPHWSPDGLHLVFWSERDGNAEVYSINADGSDPKNLTMNDSGDDFAPRWSRCGG